MLSRDTLVVDSVSLLRTTPLSFGDAPNSLEGRHSTPEFYDLADS